MEHYYKQYHYGWQFYLFIFFNIATAILVLFEVATPPYIIYALAIAFSIWTAWRENKENYTNDKIVYILHSIGAVICVYCFNIILDRVRIHTIRDSGLIVEIIGFILISLAVLPGYLLLRLYEHIVNRKLEDAYWKEYDARHENNKQNNA